MLFRVFTVLAHTKNYNPLRLPFSAILNRNQKHFPKHFKLINLRHFSESKPFYYSEIVETVSTNSVRTTEKTSQIPQILPQIHYGKLFFDNTYPLKIGSFDFRHYFVRSNKPRLERKLKSGKWIPLESIMPYNFKVEGVTPRKKEGGMLLEFSYQINPSQKTKALDEINKLVNDHLVENNIVPWFNPRPQRAYIGEPFVEDLSLYPSRPYGLIRHIFLVPSSSKETPRYATIIYKKMRSATSARYCVDGISVNSTKFDIFYETPLKTNVFFNWIASHPRISAPIIAALLAGISYIIFDPIRIFLIESNITQRFDIKEYKIYEIYKWLKKETYERFKNQDIKLEEDTLAWKEREQEEEILKKWLNEPPETFIIVSGPNGSGKSKFIDRAIHNKKKKIIIKCDEIRISHNENEFVLKLAKQVGYKPMFFSLIYLSNLIDGLASAVTGQKTVGFSSTTDSEIEKILNALEIALYNIAPDVFKVKVKLSPKSDLYAEHIYHSYDPEDIPVLVIDSFISKNAQENMELWDHLAQTAARLVEKKIAHVVFESSVTGI
ncbi:11542_t:CDS:10, partial [Diversispora eburnea]